MSELGQQILGILESAALHEHCEQVGGSDYVPVSMLVLAIRELKEGPGRVREIEAERDGQS